MTDHARVAGRARDGLPARRARDRRPGGDPGADGDRDLDRHGDLDPDGDADRDGDLDIDIDIDLGAVEGADDGRMVISPGDMLNVYEVQAIRHAFAAGAGLRPDRVLVTPYGYPPLPRPPAAAPDGRGRLPAGMALEFAGHPVLWLDGGTTRQPPGEPDDAYAIRLFLELVDRGLLDPADGRLRNLLVPLGFDVRDPEDRARLARYQSGEWDPALCSLVAGPNPATPPGAVAREAARLHGVHARAYQSLVDAFRRTVRTAVADARATIGTADFDAECGRFVAAGESLRRAAASGAGPAATRRRRAALDAAYRWLLARVAQIDGARMVLTVEIDRREHLDAPRGAASYSGEIRRAHAARCGALERHMSAVYGDPADDQRLRRLLVALRDEYHAVLARARATLARAERVAADLLAPPAGPPDRT